MGDSTDTARARREAEANYRELVREARKQQVRAYLQAKDFSKPFVFVKPEWPG